MKKIAILGSTGSIGKSTLDIIEKNPERFKVVALAAGENIDEIKRQIEKFHPLIVSVINKEKAFKLKETIRSDIEILYGAEGVKNVASFFDADLVVSAISGAAGLMPTLAAIKAGKNIALANKETMVIAGDIVTKMSRKNGVKILPVDSEHSAIFQCLEGQNRSFLKRVILTASGGPFLNLSKRELNNVKPNQALCHPKWKMGKKITIDSASLMNKGLEVIEAKWLFEVGFDKIDVLIHPQSIVHSMVEFIDGSVTAQMGIADMRIPIAYALSYPERIENNLPRLNFIQTNNLQFYKPDTEKFRCLQLAYKAGIEGGTYPAVLNAANEVAVEAYMGEKIKFTDIPGVIEKILNAHDSVKEPSLEEIMQADSWARVEARKSIERKKS
ncbi:MAG TPA: 1-deoxy-D-xylulose-5-phosphate reductoisomerase [Smithellaceae bacterium]|jgi:1-deoxy-D-xylulose-5-phosphate reductoisomerase|nr:1-deoxy-D-xylulose-5-phosphate reductoisomerase [Syntrophaceae bacterium]NMD05447.1 1-deoxy-D-xylulose-5-phosphate reductoisomerase [Deltaproteobacteria bacterium]HOM68723.1 1-deoxy-D-xylulose-5-phosphate reductoisomerase [Smithellaceae bacterium]MBP8607958.1 1-deoxy-D-xylulose-5-phosphate reductoisomerase [Syntrophaceae bacterium]HQG95179.1 1-deoxy-D-xylulose-5-phosphate reductoisomerase [Smithellaceae bacterium]